MKIQREPWSLAICDSDLKGRPDKGINQVYGLLKFEKDKEK